MRIEIRGSGDTQIRVLNVPSKTNVATHVLGGRVIHRDPPLGKEGPARRRSYLEAPACQAWESREDEGEKADTPSQSGPSEHFHKRQGWTTPSSQRK